MKAAVFRDIGRKPSKLLKIEDIETPKIKPNEVLVKIESTAYNYDDLWALYGYPIKVPMPHISGSDAAGTVMEVGEDVTKFQAGDRVVIHQILAVVYVMHAILEENTIVMIDLFGDTKQDLCGEDFHSIPICRIPTL